MARCAKSLAGLLEGEATVEMSNDDRAALLLATGQTGSRRTRRLRIRASVLERRRRRALCDRVQATKALNGQAEHGTRHEVEDAWSGGGGS